MIVAYVGQGMRWTRQRRHANEIAGRIIFVSGFDAGRRTALKRTAKACGPGARCWRQVREDRSAQPGADSVANSRTTVTRRIRRRGEYAISRKTIAQGRPVAPADTCMLVCAFLCTSCTRDRGCQPAPGLPCALCFERAEVSSKTRAHRAAGSRRRVWTFAHLGNNIDVVPDKRSAIRDP